MYHQPLPPKPPSYMQCKNEIRIFLYRAESWNLGEKSYEDDKMLISQPNLPWLFRLRQWAQLTFETDCQNVQIAQVTFLLQVICGLCAVKPQKCAHSYMGIIYVHFCLRIDKWSTVYLLRRLNLGEFGIDQYFSRKRSGLKTMRRISEIDTSVDVLTAGWCLRD